jgi:translocation and assembly module TamA
MMASGMFSGIDITLSEPKIDSKDRNVCHTVVNIVIEEALLRHVSAGVKYGSSENFGLLLSWTHYNIDGRGSKLGVSADVGKKTNLIKLKYDVYDVFRKKQSLASQALHLRENVDAYKLSKIGLESILWQTFSRGFKIGGGLCYELSNTTDKTTTSSANSDDKTTSTPPPQPAIPVPAKTAEANDHKKTKFRAIGLPFGLNFDTTDHFLDPQSGTRCSLMVTPYLGNMSGITTIIGKASVYFPIKRNSFQNLLVLSAYSKIGTIIRDKDAKIPRDKFFFSGGNNSVRGYEYQKIGPLDDDNKPFGGDSVLEFGVEPRLRLSDNLGVVIFLEGGKVYSSLTSRKQRQFMLGYGFGLRYYTPLGPVRIDVALPAKKRTDSAGKRIDSVCNLYISIGQAF